LERCEVGSVTVPSRLGVGPKPPPSNRAGRSGQPRAGPRWPERGRGSASAPRGSLGKSARRARSEPQASGRRAPAGWRASLRVAEGAQALVLLGVRGRVALRPAVAERGRSLCGLRLVAVEQLAQVARGGGLLRVAVVSLARVVREIEVGVAEA